LCCCKLKKNKRPSGFEEAAFGWPFSFSRKSCWAKLFANYQPALKKKLTPQQRKSNPILTPQNLLNAEIETDRRRTIDKKTGLLISSNGQISGPSHQTSLKFVNN